MKKIIKILLLIILSCLVCLYLGFVFLLPQIINNKAVIAKVQSSILDKTGIKTSIKGLNLKISPKLAIVLNVDDIDAKNANITVINVKNFAINYKLPQKQLVFINANSIFINGNELKQFKKEKKKKKDGKIELKNLPEINIKNLTYKSDNINLFGENINAQNGIIKLKASIHTPYLKETLKLGESGFFQFVDNKFLANKFEVTLGNSILYLDGVLVDKNKVPDFSITGEKLPASEIMATILHIQKLKEHERKFIENFKNFKGTANVNLKLKKDGIWGTCTTNNLGATAWFGIPLYFKEAVFYFRGQNVESYAVGTLGNEKVVHTLKITDLLNPKKKLVIGTMDTTLTKKFKYVPNLTVLNSVKVNLVYKLKLRKPDVYYNIDIPQKSDLIYNSFYLGMRDYKRKIFGNTFKDNSNLYLRKYKYSYYTHAKENIILSGDGLFIKNIDKNDPDKFVPQYLIIRTNGYAPTSVIGAFGEKVRGGEFKGDLKYDFKNNQVLGTFDIINARHKAFRIENAHVTSHNGVFTVKSRGLFKGEKYLAELNLKNNIFGETIIYDMKMFLDKLIFETKKDKPKRRRRINHNQISKKIKDTNITINKWEILINEIIRDKFVLKNVKLLGSMKNNIFDFSMQDLNFADGTVHAKGFYNFNNNASEMIFEAKNINSNKVAEMTLNLQNQVEGIANAKVNLKAKDMFKFLDVHSEFEIKEGFLPKLGDTEFMFKNSKYKLSQITNFDLSQKDLMKDDIKGTFDVSNSELKNINITTWHELSAVYIEGSYEMEKQYADFQLFWHYSKEAPKGIRILGVPLSFILKAVFRPENTRELYQAKLSKIPKIKAAEKNSNYYRIQLKGDINNNKTSLKLKEIK